MMTDLQSQRYKRHILLPEIGEEGQRKLLDGSVLVVGAGGLGAPLLLYLAAAGIGHIGIVDFDRVDVSNLQRQVLFTTEDVGNLKAESALGRIKALNPDVDVVGSFITEFENDPNVIESIKAVPLTHEAIYNFGKWRSPMNNMTIIYKKP